MPAFPDGEPAPESGALPESARHGAAERPWSAYVHVPFCSVRCGYCDFNTYTARELGPGADRDQYANTLATEIELAGAVLAEFPERELDTVFFGGGTPTLLPAADLAAMLDALKQRFGLVPGAEVTTEANPDTLSDSYAAELAAAGFTRVSIGMQSADERVLSVLDRTHNPDNVATAIAAAKNAGLSCSLDLIYGTPGESHDSWRTSLQAAIALEPDHISAYALGIEEGTKMGADVRRGLLPDVDPDVQADRYEIADELLTSAGYPWYEVSNFARPGHECRHNIHYWRNSDWWGFGPGAHSHIGGVRWWNVKHPRAYAQLLATGVSPAHAREVLSDRARHEEHVMLGIRLREGIAIPMDARAEIDTLVGDGLIDATAAADGRAVLTLRGRLLADRVTYALLGI
ncbi:oxygen-independent coproporphyrinogen-3 oxidase [Bowdeniella nasicola]|uniref:Heme chaperone HemW n=1 Tax=Bowdeniella nasicola TaxID=208480 RepID=A0A1H3W359_9ACTO|nr:radical SAM family heme chaperone HemW [Bowdeniella nasicola]SDZ81519.1 oxygen-independent coproporphyrinogen-3 oxidase [Bowdeniella nasicola]